MSSARHVTMDLLVTDPVMCVLLTQQRRRLESGGKGLNIVIGGRTWIELDAWCTEHKVTKTGLLESFITAFLASQTPEEPRHRFPDPLVRMDVPRY